MWLFSTLGEERLGSKRPVWSVQVSLESHSRLLNPCMEAKGDRALFRMLHKPPIKERAKDLDGIHKRRHEGPIGVCRSAQHH